MIRRRPRAISAIIEVAEYIGQNNPDAAERFMDAVEDALQLIEAVPGVGHPYRSEHPKLQDVRVGHVKGFPNHLIFYRPIPEGIEVIHVLHGARDIKSVLTREIENDIE